MEAIPLAKPPLPNNIRFRYPNLQLEKLSGKKKADQASNSTTEPPRRENIQNSATTQDEEMVSVDLNYVRDDTYNDDSSTATARTKKAKDGKHTKSSTGEKEVSFKAYINLRLKQDANPTPKNVEATYSLLSDKCKSWLMDIQQLEPSFKLHTVDPAARTQGVVHDPADFPQKLDELKTFFKGAHPNAEGGYMYLKVLGLAKGTTKQFISTVDWMHWDRSENINICQVQAYETQIIGWLL